MLCSKTATRFLLYYENNGLRIVWFSFPFKQILKKSNFFNCYEMNFNTSLQHYFVILYSLFDQSTNLKGSHLFVMVSIL